MPEMTTGINIQNKRCRSEGGCKGFDGQPAGTRHSCLPAHRLCARTTALESAAARPPRVKSSAKDGNVGVSHTSEPSGRKIGLCLVLVYQNDWSTSYRDEVIGTLNRLAAREALKTRNMTRLVFTLPTHVEQVVVEFLL
jgi:hypothetical protein